MIIEYPKALYGPQGWDNLSDCRTVNSAEEEAAARADGYRSLADPEPPPRQKPVPPVQHQFKPRR